jgi:hypothetical protein
MRGLDSPEKVVVLREFASFVAANVHYIFEGQICGFS